MTFNSIGWDTIPRRLKEPEVVRKSPPFHYRPTPVPRRQRFISEIPRQVENNSIAGETISGCRTCALLARRAFWLSTVARVSLGENALPWTNPLQFLSSSPFSLISVTSHPRDCQRKMFLNFGRDTANSGKRDK